MLALCFLFARFAGFFAALPARTPPVAPPAAEAELRLPLLMESAGNNVLSCSQHSVGPRPQSASAHASGICTISSSGTNVTAHAGRTVAGAAACALAEPLPLPLLRALPLPAPSAGASCDAAGAALTCLSLHWSPQRHAPFLNMTQMPSPLGGLGLLPLVGGAEDERLLPLPLPLPFLPLCLCLAICWGLDACNRTCHL